MNSNKTLTVLLMLAGEALIIICFLFFGQNLSSGILTLNIVVTTVIYALFFLDILFPMVDFNDKSHKTIGSLGLRWFFTSIYTIAAIAAMIIFNTVKPIDLNSQILIHAILFFLLAFGIYTAVSSSQMVHDVFIEESQNRDHIDEMKKATKNVLLKLEQMKDVPSDVNSRISALYENLRFISPSDNKAAFELESAFVNQMNNLLNCLFDFPFNYEKIIENIERCESSYKERKQIYTV